VFVVFIVVVAVLESVSALDARLAGCRIEQARVWPQINRGILAHVLRVDA